MRSRMIFALLGMLLPACHGDESQDGPEGGAGDSPGAEAQAGADMAADLGDRDVVGGDGGGADGGESDGGAADGGGGDGAGVAGLDWKITTNLTLMGDTLTKTSGKEWDYDAHAISAQQCTAGDCYVEFRASADAEGVWLGLTTDVDGAQKQRDAIDFALQFWFYKGISDYEIYAWEKGVYRGEAYPVPVDGVFRVGVVDGVVTYYSGCKVFYKSKVAPAFPLAVQVSMERIGTSVSGVTLNAGRPPCP